VLAAGELSAGVLASAGVVAAGADEIGAVVEAGVLQARTAPPRLVASATASRIRFVIQETSVCRGWIMSTPSGPRKSHESGP
jgi:hypothetical protein